MKIIHTSDLKTNTNTCHASTVAFHNGEPVFAWFGGEREGRPDSCIYIQHKDTVYKHSKFSDDGYPEWNPVLYAVHGKLFLFMKAGHFCDRWQTFIYDITDLTDLERINELPYQLLPAGLNGPVKTAPVEHDGYIHMGSSVETVYNWTSYIEKYKLIDNHFMFMHRSNPLGNETIQPALFVDKYNTLRAHFRSRKVYDDNKMYVHTSATTNRMHGNWLEPDQLELLTNPNSGVDIVCHNSKVYLAHNPSERKFDRFPLAVSELDENCREAVNQLIISDKSDSEFTNEVSYPFMIEHNDQLHLTYTDGREKIKYVVIEL